MTAQVARARRDIALKDKDSKVGKTLAEWLKAVEEAADQGRSSVTIDEEGLSLNSSQREAILSRLGERGFSVESRSTCRGPYVTIAW